MCSSIGSRALARKSERLMNTVACLSSKNRSSIRVRIELERREVRFGGAALEAEKWIEAKE